MSDLNHPSPEQPPVRLSIWRDMWLKPRAVLQQQQTAAAHWQQWAPAILAGIAAVLETFALAQQQMPAPASTNVAAVPSPTGQALLLTALLLGPLFGMIHVGLMGFVLRLIGRVFGGITTPDAMRRGVSLSLVPLAYSLPLVLFEMWWREQQPDSVWLMLSTGLRMLLNLWTLLLLVMSISELQQLNIRRAAGTLASAVALMMVLMLLLQPR